MIDIHHIKQKIILYSIHYMTDIPRHLHTNLQIQQLKRRKKHIRHNPSRKVPMHKKLSNLSLPNLRPFLFVFVFDVALFLVWIVQYDWVIHEEMDAKFVCDELDDVIGKGAEVDVEMEDAI